MFTSRTEVAISAPLAHSFAFGYNANNSITRSGYSTITTWARADVDQGMVGRCVFFLPDGSFSLCNATAEHPMGIIIKEPSTGTGFGVNAGGITNLGGQQDGSINWTYKPEYEEGNVFTIGIRGTWGFAISSGANTGDIAKCAFVTRQQKGLWQQVNDYRGWIAWSQASNPRDHFIIQAR